MNPPDNDDQEKAVSAPQQGPGSLLKKARERQGMNAASVASQLHLQVSIIDSLERDDYDNLPGPVFVQGYLRNYARLVGLKEDAVVAAYQRQFPEIEEQTILNNPERTEGKPMHSGHGVMRLVTWAIIVALAALLFFWWQTRAELEPPEPYPIGQESQPEASLPDDVNIQPADVDTQLERQEMQQAEPLATDEPVPELEASGAPLQTETLEAPVTIEPLPVQADNETLPEPVEAPAEPQVSEIEPVQAEAEVVVEETPAPVESRSKSLLFSFEGPCWTEVRSLDGKARIIGEMRRGAKRRLSSDYGPFNVVLGDASVVTLTIDGQRFDLTPFTRGKVARFTLDPNKL
ncbi:MAG: RodZ domain-containing protein [Candidatus Thiodiazotropha sp.]